MALSLRMKRSIRIRTVILAATVGLALAFGPPLAAHLRHAFDPRIFNDDVRQHIFPFFRYTEQGTASKDISGDYYLAIMPPGFKLLYRALAPVLDPEPLSKALPYLFLLLTLLGIGMAAYRLEGAVAALMALALALQTPLFLSHMVGGLARSFAFPLAALGLWALVAGRVRALAALIVVAQAFYPVAAAILGLALGALLFIAPRADRGEAEEWSWRRRTVLLVIVGSLMIALFVPMALAMRPWGRPLGPGDAVVHPEGGTDGRTGPGNRPPFPHLLVEARAEAEAVLAYAGTPLVPAVRKLVRGHEAVVMDALLLVLALGFIPLATRNVAARRALALLLAGAVGYVLARAFAPYLYLPQRYMGYTVPLFLVVFLPASGAALAGVLSPRRWTTRARTTGAVLVGGAVLVFLGGRGDPWAGYTVALHSNTRIYDFIRGLPKNVLVAGWPGGVIDDVPYFCRRRAFVTYETHTPYHERYLLEMRRRMDALIAALFSEDQQGLIELRDTFGVTHVIVNADEFSKPPWYFAPFDTEIKRAWQRGAKRGFAVENVLAKAAVFREGKLTLLDLSRL